MLALEPSWPSPSLLSGTASVQMIVPHSQFTLITYIPEEKEYLHKKRCETQVTTEFLPLSVVSLFQTWHAEPKDWILARSPFIFLSSFHFFPFSLSELRSGSAWVCSIVPQENCQSGLYSEQWKQEFYKEADLLFITSHSQHFLLPNPSIFFVELAHIATLQLPFLDFSQALFILCSFFPSLL